MSRIGEKGNEPDKNIHRNDNKHARFVSAYFIDRGR
jgi:hypothetical protein